MYSFERTFLIVVLLNVNLIIYYLRFFLSPTLYLLTQRYHRGLDKITHFTVFILRAMTFIVLRHLYKFSNLLFKGYLSFFPLYSYFQLVILTSLLTRLKVTKR